MIYFTSLYTKPHATTMYRSLVYSWPPDGASYLFKFSITIERIGSVISYKYNLFGNIMSCWRYMYIAELTWYYVMLAVVFKCLTLSCSTFDDVTEPEGGVGQMFFYCFSGQFMTIPGLFFIPLESPVVGWVKIVGFELISPIIYPNRVRETGAS